MMTKALFLSVASITHLFISSAFAQTDTGKIESLLNPLIHKLETIRLERATCVEKTNELMQDVHLLNPNALGPIDYKGATSVAKRIYLGRLHLREEMTKLYYQKSLAAEHNLHEKCAINIKRTLRYYRALEDYLGHNAVRVEPNLNAKASKQFFFNPKMKNEYSLRSGDILLSRGTGASSSVIARLSDEDTQFSHLALVHVDSKSGKASLIEAHIEYGVKISPIDTWFKDGKKRTVLYRFKDRDQAGRSAKIAADAAGIMMKKTAEYERTHKGKHIPYDFGFDMNNHDKVFCSEVARIGYEEASGNKVKIPFFPSSLRPKNTSFLNLLGIHQVASFMPADIEIDPRFQPILEWRNFAEIKSSWVRDAISTKVYEWMENYGVEYDVDWVTKTLASAAKKLRSIGLIKKHIAPNATVEMLELMIKVDTFYDDIEEDLRKREKAVIARRGTPFTYFEVLGQLELMRLSDTIHNVLHRP